MTEADQLIQEVEQCRPAQGAFKPGEGQWSVAEVLEHLYLAALSGVAKIWAGLNALRANTGWTEARPNR